MPVLGSRLWLDLWAPASHRERARLPCALGVRPCALCGAACCWSAFLASRDSSIAFKAVQLQRLNFNLSTRVAVYLPLAALSLSLSISSSRSTGMPTGRLTGAPSFVCLFVSLLSHTLIV